MHPDTATPPDPVSELQPAPEKRSTPARRIVSSVFIGIFGIALPIATLLIELLTGLCGEVLFNPIPTPFHAVLVALVPVANAILLIAVTRENGEGLTWLAWLNGIAIGIAIYYALVFLPVSPFALIGVIFYGVGLLPLSPLFAFACAIVLRFRLRRVARSLAQPLPRVWLAMCLGLATLVAVEAPRTVSLAGLQMATSDNVATRTQGIRMLRRFGSRDTLLRSCYWQRGIARDPLSMLLSSFGRTVSVDQARTVYYRVTGAPFNSVPAPSLGGRDGVRIFGRFDSGLGGQAVMGRVQGLGLKESTMDTSVDADAALSYTEWTLVFENRTHMQQEARCQVALPPGGVVSRLTLWIDGEECEAAFGSRRQVREAYQKVVRRRRDPVLITTTGPDRVLVQCFPVPPGNGTMKIRFGITAPLLLTSPDAGHYRLPYFTERNFGIPAELKSATWLEGDTPLTLADAEQPGIQLEQEAAGNETYALRGTVDATATEKQHWLQAERDASVTRAWALDTRGDDEAGVVQRIVPETIAPPERVLLVVDGSRRMRRFRGDMAKAIEAIPDGIELGVILAGDEAETLVDIVTVDDASREAAASALEQQLFAGGCDNVAALVRAWDLASQSTNGAIVWVHGTQPVKLGDTSPLTQRWNRRPDGPRLIAIPFGGGPDVITPELVACTDVDVPPLPGPGEQQFQQLVEEWAGRSPRYRFVRTRHASAEEWRKGVETSDHVVRLWAHDTIGSLLAADGSADRDKAVNLAVRYQLVTPVSGAVVLETQQQYDEAGLEPVDKSSVPTIPEPETWALMIVAAIALGWHLMNRNRFPLRMRI